MMAQRRGLNGTGKSSETLLKEMMTRGHERGLYSAAVGLVTNQFETVFSFATGSLSDDIDASPASMLTIFDAASITKPITAMLLLQCVEQGRLHLEQPLAALLPEAAESAAAKVTVRQLATHTSGLPAWKAIHHAANPLKALLSTPLEAEPGTQYCYSDLGYILLGTIIMRLCGRPLEHLAFDQIFRPLGMGATTFNPPQSVHTRIAATTAPLGKVHDPNARGLGGVAGHAGIFTTAQDLTLLGNSLLNSLTGTFGEKVPQILCPAAARLAALRQTPTPLPAHTIGWFAWPNGYLPKADLLSDQTFGHTGFTGTMMLIDPSTNTLVILLTNRVLFENSNDGSEVLTLRRLFANVAGSLVRG